MDIEDIKKESVDRFNEFVNMYTEQFEGKLSKQYFYRQFKHFNDPVGLFIYPYLYDIYSFPAREYPDNADGESLEPWQRQVCESYIREKTSEMVQNFGDYMWHVLVTKAILTALEIDDDETKE